MQIRTEEMHRRAEEGIAAHWKYKEGRVGAGRDEQYFQWLRQLLEWQQEVRDPQEFLTNLKIDLYPEEVYTFTPRGQVKVLPEGATPVDFAYAVHTDVGHQCVGARVNGRMVPLRTRLKNGDIVEIMTNPAHKPSRDWLSFVGDLARAQQDQAPDPVRGEGARRRVGPQALREGGPALRPQPREAARERRRCKAAAEEFGAQQGRGPARPDRLRQGLGAAGARQAGAAGQLKEKAPEHPVLSAVKRVLQAGRRRADRIKVSGADDLMVFRARCCNPIRGEQIVGYITRGKGVSVHSATLSATSSTCSTTRERRIDVEWDKGSDTAPYTVRLTMEVEDRKGMLAGAQRAGGRHQHQHHQPRGDHRRLRARHAST